MRESKDGRVGGLIPAHDGIVWDEDDPAAEGEAPRLVSVGDVPVRGDAGLSGTALLDIFEAFAGVCAAWSEWDELSTEEEFMGRFLDGMVSEQETRMLDGCAELISATCELAAALDVSSLGGFIAKCARRRLVSAPRGVSGHAGDE